MIKENKKNVGFAALRSFLPPALSGGLRPRPELSKRKKKDKKNPAVKNRGKTEMSETVFIAEITYDQRYNQFFRNNDIAKGQKANLQIMVHPSNLQEF